MLEEDRRKVLLADNRSQHLNGYEQVHLFAVASPALARHRLPLLIEADSLTMPCTAHDYNNIDAMLNAAREGQKGPVDEKNPDQFFSPLYSIAGYTNTVDDWVNTYRVTPPIEISYTDILSQPKEIYSQASAARGMLSRVDDNPPLSDLQCVKLRGETEITFDINHGKPCWEDLGFQMPSGPDAGIPTHDRGGFEHTSDRRGMPSNGGARGIHLGDESESEDMGDLFDEWFCGIESRNSGTSRGANTNTPMLLTDLVPSEEKVKVTLTISGLGLFPVQPGDWFVQLSLLLSATDLEQETNTWQGYSKLP